MENLEVVFDEDYSSQSLEWWHTKNDFKNGTMNVVNSPNCRRTKARVTYFVLKSSMC